MTDTVTSPSGKALLRRATWKTTPQESAEAKVVRISQQKMSRLEENRALLADRNVAAFLKAIAEAEGLAMITNTGLSRERETIPGAFRPFPRTPDPEPPHVFVTAALTAGVALASPLAVVENTPRESHGEL